MPRDPRSRLTDEGAQPLRPETPSGLAPEVGAEPGRKPSAADAEWLSMATADPALYLKDLRRE